MAPTNSKSYMTGQSQTNTQREDARNSVIETATQMFHAQGIRNVTMDDIAHKLSMSKRTLYQLFTDKEDLLLACVIKHEGDVRTHLAAIISQSANVLDFLLIKFLRRPDQISTHKGAYCTQQAATGGRSRKLFRERHQTGPFSRRRQLSHHHTPLVVHNGGVHTKRTG